MTAFIVVDLGFGDAGKGLLTDHLVRRTGAGLVVRFNGGAQAGHNVVTPDGLQHTFSQIGAGAFAGARTFLSRHMIVHPTALLVEARALEDKGLRDPLARVRISERARLITPYHQAINRLRELARGEARHGTCGVGVGEVVRHALSCPEESIWAADLRDRSALRAKLDRVREHEWSELRQIEAELPRTARVDRERIVFDDAGLADAWIGRAAGLANIVTPDEAVRDWTAGSSIVFEGAQGVLLDETYGFQPHTTWSCCTPRNALELAGELWPAMPTVRFGVVRSHAVRHGAGPLPSETDQLRDIIKDLNRANDWQGEVRYGWFDAVLTRYALEKSGGIDALALTHADVVDRLAWICVDHEPKGEPPSAESLACARPVLERAPASLEGYLARLESLLDRPIDLVSCGPRAADVSSRRPQPLCPSAQNVPDVLRDPERASHL